MVKQSALDAFTHHDVPFDRVVEHVKPRRDLSRAPIFQTMFVYNKEIGPLLEMNGFVVEQLDVDAAAVELDLSVRVTERPSGTTASFEFSTDLFDTATVERLVDSWSVLLAAAVADSAMRVGSLPLLSARDQRAAAGASGAGRRSMSSPDSRPSCCGSTH